MLGHHSDWPIWTFVTLRTFPAPARSPLDAAAGEAAQELEAQAWLEAKRAAEAAGEA